MTGIEDRIQTVGERIRARQRVTRVTNEELARAADVHVKTVSQWRHDRQKPTDDNLAAIAPLLRSSYFFLKHGRDPEPDAGEDAEDFVSGMRNMAVHEGYRIYHTWPITRLPPRARTAVSDYMNRLIQAGLSFEELDEAQRFLIDAAYNKINAREPGEKSEDDLILDIKAAWQFVREVVNRNGAKV